MRRLSANPSSVVRSNKRYTHTHTHTHTRARALTHTILRAHTHTTHTHTHTHTAHSTQHTQHTQYTIHTHIHTHTPEGGCRPHQKLRHTSRQRDQSKRCKADSILVCHHGAQWCGTLSSLVLVTSDRTIERPNDRTTERPFFPLLI